MNPMTFVGIGEVLYDVFEDETETLGGAPLNLAIHAHQLATRFGMGDGTIVSCINSDRRGYKILVTLHRLKMSTYYIGKDSSHPTGLVSVFMRNGEPGYQVEAGYSPEIVAYSCQAATIIKANQSELFAILDLLGIARPSDRNLSGIRHGMELLLARFPAQAIVVTRGAPGTVVLTRNGEFDLATPISTEGPSRPVGAGDACSAGISGSVSAGICTRQWSLRTGWGRMWHLSHSPLHHFPKARSSLSTHSLR